MALSASQVAEVIRGMVADINDATFNNISHADFQAAVSAVDAWATSNAAAYNSALPDPFKSTATTAQKALLLSYVCLKRAGK